MRLIDADELERKCLSDIQDNDANIWDIMNNIRRTKTVYNIDKVIEELEELQEGMLAGDYCCANLDFCRHVDCDKCEQIIVTDKAIEIVRDGGIKNEV